MRTIKNRVNNNSVNNSKPASTKPASEKITKPAAKPKATEKPVALTEEQINRAKAVKYILDHLCDKNGNRRLEVVKEDGEIYIDVLAPYKDDSKLCEKARFSIFTSARVLDLKWNADEKYYNGMTIKDWCEAVAHTQTLPSESTTEAPASKTLRKPNKSSSAKTDKDGEKIFTAAEAKARAMAMLNYLLGDSKAIDAEKRTKMVEAAFKIA